MTAISDFLHNMIGKYLLLVIKPAQMINRMSCKPQMITGLRQPSSVGVIFIDSFSLASDTSASLVFS